MSWSRSLLMFDHQKAEGLYWDLLHPRRYLLYKCGMPIYTQRYGFICFPVFDCKDVPMLSMQVAVSSLTQQTSPR